MQIISLIIIGLFAGFSSGLLGIGGGVIFVPAISLVLGLSFHKAVGISLAVIVPTAFVGMLKHYSEGNVDFKIVAIIALFAMIGSWLGASSASVLPAAMLKKVFAVILIFIGFNMFFGWTSALASQNSKVEFIEDISQA